MILDKSITINEVAIKVMPASQQREDGLLAFVEVRLIDTVGDTFEKVRGITIKERNFQRGNAIVVDFPAFRSHKGFFKSVFFENKNFYFKLIEEIIRIYEEKSLSENDIPF